MELLIALKISLIITAIHVTTWPGMIFNEISQRIFNFAKRMFKGDSKKAVFACKPLFGCLMCMSSVWTLLLYYWIGERMNVIELIFIVCGINAIITAMLNPIIPFTDD